MNLHDWIDELADVLDVETEVDEGLILDLARVAAQNVQKTAAPITAYLLGVAVGAGDANPEQVERLAARAQQLAESWDRPADAKDPDDVDDEVPRRAALGRPLQRPLRGLITCALPSPPGPVDPRPSSSTTCPTRCPAR